MRRKATWQFLESSEFQRARETYLSDVEFEAVKELVPRHPEKWIALKGGPGLFALHWGVRTPITVVFIISPETRKVFLLGTEPGRHYSVTDEVKRHLPALIKQLEKLGNRVAIGYGIRQLVSWLIEHWPWP